MKEHIIHDKQEALVSLLLISVIHAEISAIYLTYKDIIAL